MNTKDFMNDVNIFESGEILDWKKDGKVIVLFHPSGFASRRVVWFPTVTEQIVKKKGGRGTEIKNSVENTILVLPPVEQV